MKTAWPEFDQLLAEIHALIAAMLADEDADEAANDAKIEATYAIERELMALAREVNTMTREAIVSRLALLRLKLDRRSTVH